MARPRKTEIEYRLRANRQGYYAIYWTESGQTRSVSTGTKERREAEDALTRFKAGRSAPVVSGPRISALLDAYLEARKDRPSAPTMRGLAKTLRPRFGALEPREVTDRLVMEHAKARLAAGLSRSTVVSDLILLRSAVNWAIRQRLVGPEQKLTFEMPVQRSPARDRWLTREEAKALIDACHAPHIRLFVRLALSTGARRTAILGLKWPQVDFKTNRIDFGEGNRNKRRAIVPINATLRQELVAAKEAAASDYVVEYGGHHITDLRTGLEAAATRAGIQHVHPHLFRHTAATWMVMDGVSLREVARFLGITELMVEKVYGKHSPDFLSRAAASVEI